MSDVTLHPTDKQLAALSDFERRAFKLAHFFNSNKKIRAVSRVIQRRFNAVWLFYATHRRIHLLGLDHMRALDESSGILLASNHRTFYDQYVMSVLLYRTTALKLAINFPVRAEFFYQHPVGVGMNMALSWMAMYPPIFREPSKRDFNNYSVARLVQLLGEPGAVVGIHPEGTRNKEDDPYALLRAQPGIGKVIVEAKPTVVPIFINGLTNDLRAEVSDNFKGTGKPIIIVFGEPLDLSEFYAKPNKLRTHKETADFVLEEIGKLGEVERAYRDKISKYSVTGPVFD
jgi:1-acyl-sn-glycerol-3-phosphate acyltransferase